nr:MAG TPA: hypothetical protein [Bacteriophage sp.]
MDIIAIFSFLNLLFKGFRLDDKLKAPNRNHLDVQM